MVIQRSEVKITTANMKSFLISAVLVLASCVTLDTKTSPYEAYQHYLAAVKSNQPATILVSFFSKDLANDIDPNDSSTVEQLNFGALMSKESVHYAESYNDYSCLTVNGFDSEDLPMAFNLKYVIQNQSWVIEHLEVLYVEDSTNLPGKATCPQINTQNHI